MILELNPGDYRYQAPVSGNYLRIAITDFGICRSSALGQGGQERERERERLSVSDSEIPEPRP